MRLVIFIIGSLLSSFAIADSNLLSQAHECKNAKEDTLRLACYDKLFSSKSLNNTLNEEFGLEHKQVLSESPVSSLELLVAKVKKDPYGKLQITLQNGQVWKQVDTDKLRLKSGNKVVISRGALGSFRLSKADSNRVYKVKRLK